MPQGPRRSAGVAGLAVGLFIAVTAVGGAVALVLFSVGTEVGTPVESGTVEAVTAAPAPPEAAATPTGLAAGSLIRKRELAKALAALRAKELGKLTSLRIAPERINVQYRTKDGRLHIVQVDPGAKVRVIHTTGPGFNSLDELVDVDVAAPERMVRAALERTKKDAAQVDYLVLMNLTEPTWGLFFKDGTHFQADAAGKITRRVG
jgi:hypothetical protein